MTLPRVLSDPPWRHVATSEAPKPKAAVTVEHGPAELRWEAGEREAFRGKPPPKMTEQAEEKLFERLLDELDKKAPLRTSDVARLGDEKLAELALEFGPSTMDAATMKVLLGRVGDAFVANAVTIVRAAPRERNLFEAALPVRSSELAWVAASSFFEREAPTAIERPFAPSYAEAWLLRHAEVAAKGLVPPAIDEGHTQASARAGLAFLATHGKMDAMRDVLAPHAELAAWLVPFADLAPLATDADLVWGLVFAARGMDRRAMEILGERPGTEAYRARLAEQDAEKKLGAAPEAVATLPEFFDIAALPRPRLTDGTPLPDGAVRTLGEMLRFSPLRNPYLGLVQVRQACDAESLDAFALDLLARWRAAGEEPREAWAFETCGKIGGEACAREIATRVRSWARGAEAPRGNFEPGSRGFTYARTGCAILGVIATETGLLLLDDIAKTGVQAWLRREAHQVLGDSDGEFDEVEAPIPTVGLDEDGSASFDLGARIYRVHFTEGLSPYLVDQEGARIEAFPRSRKDDDAAKYATAKERFTSIAKDSKIVARYQTALVQSMMCTQRTFTAAAFRERFVQHPLLRHLGRRVVWSASPGDAHATFRIAEDGSFADEEDAAFDLALRAVTVVHPILMSEAMRQAWKTRLTDYQLMQPFLQLARALHRLPPDQIGEMNITNAIGIEASRGRLFGLGRRGWRARFDRHDVTEYTKQLPCGAAARFEVSPPVTPEGDGEIFKIVLAACSWQLDRLPAIDYSELVLDLESARA